MRLSVRTLFVVFSTFIILSIVLFWSKCSNGEHETFAKLDNVNNEVLVQNIQPIDCLINGNTNHVDCLLKENMVYIPFSFLRSYFEIYGKMVDSDDNKKTFYWSHSYSKVYHQIGKYDPQGVFTNFQNYKVEERDRVKCVSASDGVPISTQWNPAGYYYPTQIAQFGLSHYSKNLVLPLPRVKILENGQLNSHWDIPSMAKLQIEFNTQINNHVINFSSEGDAISLNINDEEDFFLSFDVALSTSSSVVVVLKEIKEPKNFIWNLHYNCGASLISVEGNNIYHGMNCDQMVEFNWKKLRRNLLIDLQKGLHVLKQKTPKMFRLKYKVCKFKLFGVGYLDNLTLSSSNHLGQFYAAAEWFVKNQDKETGGWQNPVTRKISPVIKTLTPGWLSAMGQGQAISLLARAFFHSGGNKQYLDSAFAALKPFKVLTKKGGVLSKFMNLYPWYEEYPTVPSIFILNGFMYSLIGLYDLFTLAPAETQVSKESYSLWKKGMTSLKHMLPLFDMGSRSAYDLRHVTHNVAPNIARWDYHATHINQLLLLATLDNATVIQSTAKRWIGYMSGSRASHN